MPTKTLSFGFHKCLCTNNDKEKKLGEEKETKNVLKGFDR